MAETNGVGLTEDLLLEILLRLPLKCIYQSKCVSPAWQRLISDRHVAKRLPLILSGVFYRLDGEDHKLEPRYGCNSNVGAFLESDLSYLPFHHNSSIIDSCNGLLLFYRGLPSGFHVCNPTTRRWVALPLPRCRTQLSVLAFDPYHSPNYKVLCFTGWQGRGGQLEVFSSETSKWVDHTLHWGLDTDKMSASMHYFDGVLHILAYPRHVVCIELEEMTCTVINLPEEMKHDTCLGSSGGFLHCAVNDGKELRIWVRKGSRWLLKHRLSVAGIMEWGGATKDMVSCSGLLHRGRFSFMAFHPREDVLYIWVLDKLVSYDLCEQRLDLVWQPGLEKERLQLIQVWLFPFSSQV